MNRILLLMFFAFLVSCGSLDYKSSCSGVVEGYAIEFLDKDLRPTKNLSKVKYSHYIYCDDGFKVKSFYSRYPGNRRIEIDSLVGADSLLHGRVCTFYPNKRNIREVREYFEGHILKIYYLGRLGDTSMIYDYTRPYKGQTNSLFIDPVNRSFKPSYYGKEHGVWKSISADTSK